MAFGKASAANAVGCGDKEPQEQSKEMRAADEAQLPGTEWKPTKQTAAMLLTLFIISIVVALDATILVPALPTIAEKLRGSTNEMFWAGTSYLLTSSTSQPVLVALSDIFGRRSLLLISLGFFTAGTVIIVLAHNFTVLLIGRAIQGVGGGGIMALNLVLITDLVPLRQRPKYTAPIQIGWAFGTIVGPLIGGAFAKSGEWRWIFYINFPFCAVGFPMIWFFVRLPPKNLTLKDVLRRVDWVGSGLFMASTTSFLIGLTWAGTQYPWLSWQVLVPLLVGAVGLVLTGIWEFRFASHPFVRRSFLKSWSTMCAYFCTMIQGMMLYAGLYYLSLFLLSVMSKDPVMTGVSLLPISCGLLPSAVISGLLITKLGKYRWSIWFGWAVGTLGAGLLLLLNSGSPIQKWFFIFMILGISHGALLTGHNFAVQASVNQSEISQATSLFSFFRSFGLCLGVAIPQAIFLSGLNHEISSRGFSRELLSTTSAIIHYLSNADRNSPEYLIVIEILTKSFHFLFWVLTAISGATFLISLLLGRHTLDRQLHDDTDSVPNDIRDNRSSPPPNSDQRDIDTISSASPPRLGRVVTHSNRSLGVVPSLQITDQVSVDGDTVAVTNRRSTAQLRNSTISVPTVSYSEATGEVHVLQAFTLPNATSGRGDEIVPTNRASIRHSTGVTLAMTIKLCEGESEQALEPQLCLPRDGSAFALPGLAPLPQQPRSGQQRDSLCPPRDSESPTSVWTF